MKTGIVEWTPQPHPEHASLSRPFGCTCNGEYFSMQIDRVAPDSAWAPTHLSGDVTVQPAGGSQTPALAGPALPGDEPTAVLRRRSAQRSGNDRGLDWRRRREAFGPSNLSS